MAAADFWQCAELAGLHAMQTKVYGDITCPSLGAENNTTRFRDMTTWQPALRSPFPGHLPLPDES